MKSILETQTTILDKLTTQNHERNDQQRVASPHESNKSLPSNFLQQQEVQ